MHFYYHRVAHGRGIFSALPLRWVALLLAVALSLTATLLLTGCGRPEKGRLDQVFGLPAGELESAEVIVPRLALRLKCSEADFSRAQVSLRTNGFTQWGVFHGVLGTGGQQIFGHVRRDLLYSFKYEDGQIVRMGEFTPVAVFDPERLELYLVLATDFGG